MRTFSSGITGLLQMSELTINKKIPIRRAIRQTPNRKRWRNHVCIGTLEIGIHSFASGVDELVNLLRLSVLRTTRRSVLRKDWNLAFCAIAWIPQREGQRLHSLGTIGLLWWCWWNPHGYWRIMSLLHLNKTQSCDRIGSAHRPSECPGRAVRLLKRVHRNQLTPSESEFTIITRKSSPSINLTSAKLFSLHQTFKACKFSSSPLI